METTAVGHDEKRVSLHSKAVLVHEQWAQCTVYVFDASHASHAPCTLHTSDERGEHKKRAESLWFGHRDAINIQQIVDSKAATVISIHQPKSEDCVLCCECAANAYILAKVCIDFERKLFLTFIYFYWKFKWSHLILIVSRSLPKYIKSQSFECGRFYWFSFMASPLHLNT